MYNKKHTLIHNIGFSYERFIKIEISKDYDQVWLWNDFPESLLFELNIIQDYDIFCKYRYDMGADLVAIKDDVYYFIQCKNFSKTILIDDFAGFYFFIHENNLNGIVYYNGQLSKRLTDLNKKVKSDLTESFLVIDHGKNLNELNKKEQNIIKEQDSYSKYQNTNAYCQKASGLYKIAYYAISIGKWFILL